MDEPDGPKSGPDRSPHSDARFSAAVETYLGGADSPQRRARLEAISRRLRLEGSPVVIREPGVPPLIAYTTSSGADDVQGFEVVDLGELPAPRTEALLTLFGLTAAEARLAQALAVGESLEAAARRLAIKPTTARTQLAAIFEKTGTRRQAQLVALLSRLAHIG